MDSLEFTRATLINSEIFLSPYSPIKGETRHWRLEWMDMSQEAWGGSPH